jgi:signal peptidase I
MSASTAVSPARIAPKSLSAPLGRPLNAIAEKIRAHGSACFRVLGMSMFPWIRPGDFVFVRRSLLATASPGNVVLFERDDRLFVHRVLRRLKTDPSVGINSMIVTKGDALDGEDSPVSPAEFLGRVTRIHRGLRHIDLESAGHIYLGRLLALVSRRSSIVYRPLRFFNHILFS